MGRQIYKEKGLIDVAHDVKAPRMKVETKIEEKMDKELETINKKMFNTAQASSTVAMNELYNTHSDNPVKLQEALDKVQIDTADLFRDEETKSAFLLNSEVSKISYMNRSKNNFKKKQDKEFKMSSEAVVDTNMDLMKENAISMWTGDKDARVLLNESFTNIKEQLQATDSEGAPIYSDADIKGIEKEFSDMKVDSYKDNLDQLFITNPAQAEEYVNDFNTKTRKQLGLERDEYDSIKRYNKTMKTELKRLKDEVDPNTGRAYTDEEKLALIKIGDQVRVAYDNFNISKKNGKVTVGNDKSNNISSLMTIRNGIEMAYAGKGLTKAERNRYLQNTFPPLLEKIKKEDLDYEGSMFSTTTQESLSRLVMKDADALNDTDKVAVWEKVYNAMNDKEIPQNSISEDDRSKVRDLYYKAKANVLKEMYPSGGDSMAVSILSGEKVTIFNKDGDKSVGVNLNDTGGYHQVLKKDGSLWNVKYNKDGTIRDESRAR